MTSSAGAVIGRVGGLAIALGIGGAVWLTGHGVAAAATSDTPDTPAAGRSAAQSGGPARPAAHPSATRPARGPAPASAVLRRTRQPAANAARPEATGAVASGSIAVTTDIGWNDGILEGYLDATSSRGLPLSYTLVERPQGGKVTLTAGPPGTERFSYLPYMTALTDPTQSEQFSILVAETTRFDSALESLPVIGPLIPTALTTLRQVPIISTLLAPLIGQAVLVGFDVNPAELAAGRPVAFTYKMPSFDGTLISLNYYPSLDVATGQTASAPTVLNGPDLGFPGNTEATFVWAPSLVEIVPGIPVLREGASPFAGGYTASTGFNVITWDPRGEWASGGVLQLDSPFYEGRDVSAIISWAAGTGNIAQSQVATTQAGDPLIGMVGGSYGGGIQLSTAATDPRIDAIVPSIAWNTLNESLYPDSTFKTVIATELLLALVASRSRINAEIYPAILSGSLLGVLSPTAQALLTSSGSGILAGLITAPSLFLQGTVDILFELDAASTNAQYILSGDPAVPVKTTWFCGGHGVCLLDLALQEEQGNANMSDTLRWLDAYVAGNSGAADSIPVFGWYDQTGQYYSSQRAPFDPAFNNPAPLTYRGAGGNLLLVPLLGGSGPSAASVPPARPTVFSTAFALASGGKAWNAVNLDVAPPVGTQIAGAPTLSFTYRGLGTSRAVYAQLVDNASGNVVGNIVTPVPVTLDGRERTVDIALADIAYTVYGATDSMTLQITSSALPYANLTAWGVIDIADVSLDVPTVAVTR